MSKRFEIAFSCRRTAIFFLILIVLLFDMTASESEKYIIIKAAESSEASKTILLSPAMNEEVSLLTSIQMRYQSPGRREKGKAFEFGPIKNQADCSFPQPVHFVWSRKSKNPPSEYILQISDQSDFSAPHEINAGKNTSISVNNFETGRTYHWRIKTLGDGTADFSDIAAFRTIPSAPRRLLVPGLSNVRDLGGWQTSAGKRVRQSMIFRGSEFDCHMKIEPEGVRVLLDEMKIRTDLDLRGPAEWQNKPDYYSPLGRNNVNWVNIPLSNYDGIFSDSQKEKYYAIFKFLANEENYPIYMHCWGGADRTGTLALVINAVLGVSDDDLFADFELTSLAIFGSRSVESENFKKFLDKLAEWGDDSESLSVKLERYILSTGITQDEIGQIRSILLEP